MPHITQITSHRYMVLLSLDEANNLDHKAQTLATSQTEIIEDIIDRAVNGVKRDEHGMFKH